MAARRWPCGGWGVGRRRSRRVSAGSRATVGCRAGGCAAAAAARRGWRVSRRGGVRGWALPLHRDAGGGRRGGGASGEGAGRGEAGKRAVQAGARQQVDTGQGGAPAAEGTVRRAMRVKRSGVKRGPSSGRAAVTSLGGRLLVLVGWWMVERRGQSREQTGEEGTQGKQGGWPLIPPLAQARRPPAAATAPPRLCPGGHPPQPCQAGRRRHLQAAAAALHPPAATRAQQRAPAAANYFA